MTAAESALDWRDSGSPEMSAILRHAGELFYEKGFHGTTVRDIAQRVGVTVPALYYHHENKEAILAAVLETAIDGLLPRGEAAVAAGGDDPVRQLANLVECVALYLTTHAHLVALDSEFRYLGPEARVPFAEKRRANELLMRSVIQRGLDRGVFSVDDAAEATRAVLAMLMALARWYDATGPLAPAEIAARYVRLSLALVGARRVP